MIISTTSSLEGKIIKEYRGVVFGDVINGIHFSKDYSARLAGVYGGRVEEYEEELAVARADAVNQMIEKAKMIGANALVGVKVDVETLSVGESTYGDMLIVTASGTAVVVE